MSRFRRRFIGFSAVAGSLALALGTGVPSGTASSIPVVQSIGKPLFASGSSATPYPTSRTVVHWSDSFTYQGVTYPFTMVGTSPFGPAASTVVPTELIPINLVFSNGGSMDGTNDVAPTLASPIFSKYSFSYSKDSGVQYGDAIFRSQFNLVGSGYHLELGQPLVSSTVTLDVPSNQGLQVQVGKSGPLAGLIDFGWFSSRLNNLLGQLHIDATTLPIFVTQNVYGYFGNDPNNCCLGGYHATTKVISNNGNDAIQTFIFATYGTPGTFTAPFTTFSVDINAISHEVSEWQDDPFITNYVPAWSVPTEPQYGCSNLLETGDPLVGVSFKLGGYHPQDEAFLSWFARQVPSIAQGGRYTYLGTFTSPSPSC